MTTELDLIEKLKTMRSVAVRYESEAEGLRSQAKNLEKQAKAQRDEMDELLIRFNPDQIELLPQE